MIRWIVFLSLTLFQPQIHIPSHSLTWRWKTTCLVPSFPFHFHDVYRTSSMSVSATFPATFATPAPATIRPSAFSTDVPTGQAPIFVVCALTGLGLLVFAIQLLRRLRRGEERRGRSAVP